MQVFIVLQSPGSGEQWVESVHRTPEGAVGKIEGIPGVVADAGNAEEEELYQKSWHDQDFWYRIIEYPLED